MTHENYLKIMNNKTPDATPSMKLRIEYADVVVSALRCLDKDRPMYDACQRLIAHSYYHWLPDYFFTTPASSTGKYHPAFANESNGLMLHSLAVARLAKLMCDILPDSDRADENLIVTAAWLHDMLKYGDPAEYAPGKYTTHDHPVLAAGFFADPDVERCMIDNFGFDHDSVILISDLIKTHMGPYTTSKYSDVVLEEPKTSLQKLVFTADYLASRKENDIVKDVMRS